MTISKKSLIAGVLILGMYHNSHTHYDAAALKNEVNQILDFAQNLQYQPNDSAYKAAKYLKKLINSNNYCYVGYDSSATNDDIIALARIVNSTETFDAKTASILNIKAKKAGEKAQKIEANAEQQAKWAKDHAKQQAKYDLEDKKNLAKYNANNLKIKVRDACVLTALITIYSSIIAYNVYTKLMRSIQGHKNNLRSELGLELRSQMRSMINDTIIANNAKKQTNWLNYVA